VTLSVGLYEKSKSIDRVLEIKAVLETALNEQKVACHVQAWSDRLTVTCHTDFSIIVAQVCANNPHCASISEDYTIRATDFLDEETYLYITSGKSPQLIKVCDCTYFVT
jgi:hypothetical protein